MTDYSVMSIEEIERKCFPEESNEMALIRLTKESGRIPVDGTFKTNRYAFKGPSGYPYLAAYVECE